MQRYSRYLILHGNLSFYVVRPSTLKLYFLNFRCGGFVFVVIGKRLEGEEAVYYMHNKKGGLEGMILTCVDDFDLAGTEEFVEMVTEKVGVFLDVSKVEDDSFRFTGIDIKKVEDGIEVSMEDYAESLEEMDIREYR